MLAVVQRVSWAEVEVEGEIVGRIERGLVVYVGVERGDGPAERTILARKLVELRVFPGRTPFDIDVREANGALLVISQFTLMAGLRRGRRPSFDSAETPAHAHAALEALIEDLRGLGVGVATGRFGAHMRVRSENDGPVTIPIVIRGGAVQ